MPTGMEYFMSIVMTNLGSVSKFCVLETEYGPKVETLQNFILKLYAGRLTVSLRGLHPQLVCGC